MAEIDGTSGPDTLNGTSADDTINGLGGNDTLNGDSGNDTLDGGAGVDQLFAGDGNDTLIIANTPTSGEIFDGGNDTDTLLVQPTAGVLLNLAAGPTTAVGLGPVTLTSIERLQFGSTAGSGLFASLPVALLASSGITELVGGDGRDSLNIIAATPGNYTIPTLTLTNWNASSDPLNPGDIVALVANGAGSFTLNAAAGHAGVQALVGGAGDDTLNGTSGSEILNGGAGVNIINAGDGNDVIILANVTPFGGSPTSLDYTGNTFDGGAGFDYLSVGGEVEFNGTLSSVEGVNFQPSFTATGPGTSSQVEAYLEIAATSLPGNVSLRGAGTLVVDVASGAAFDGTNYVFENGSDVTVGILGSAGNETLHGTTHDDIISGADGNDVMDGGAGIDTAYYENAGAGVTVSLAIAGTQNTGGAGLDTLTNFEGITGSTFNDTLRGNSGANALEGGTGDDYLFGNAGNDTLIGGAGYDRMYGGLGDDTYYVNDDTDFAYEDPGEGHDQVISSVDVTLRDNVEDLVLTGAAYIGKGNAIDNLVTGTDLANKLYGYEGNDTLNGMGGDDYLFGADGNDILTGGAGYDRMYGGIGDDTYYVNDTTDYAYENLGEGNDKVISSLASYQLRANVEELDLAEGSTVVRGYGQDQDNVIIGNSYNDFLYGRGGNDIIKGGGGADLLYGESGNDTLEGGAGMDRFYGGTGADTFLFRDGDFAGMTSGTADRIHDFSQAEGDQLDFSNVDANTLTGGDQAFSFIGNAAFGHHAGELRYYQQSGVTYVAGDTNGDGVADFTVRIDALHTLQASDFIL